MEVQGKNISDGKYSSIEGFSRDVKRMREQWQRMKVVAKRNISAYKKHMNGTGGGPPVAEPVAIDWLIKDLLPHEFVEDTSPYDNDALSVSKQSPSYEPPEKLIRLEKSIDISHIKDDICNTPSTSRGSCSFTEVQSSSFHKEEEVVVEDNSFIDDSEEIHIIVEPSGEEGSQQTPKARKTAPKKMSDYEEQLLFLNKKRMELVMDQLRELHNLKMKNEKEYHAERMRLLRERMDD